MDYADYFKKLGLQLHDQIVSDAKDREPSNSEQFRTINSKPRNSIPLTSSSIGLVNQLNKEKERDDRFHVPSGDPLPDVTRLNDESLPSMIKDENDIEVSNVKLNDYEDNSVNPLEKGHVTLDDVPTTFPLSFNLAAYVVKSSTLQKLVDLGVDLAKWDTMKDVPSFIAKLDFEKDMKPHIQFLHDVGVPTEALGKFLTKTPLIFKCDLDDLQVTSILK